MLFVDFPLSGDIRWPLIFFEWFFTLICFELGLIFLLRYKKAEKGLRNEQELGYASLMFGFSVMWIFFLISDYYVSDEIISPFLIWSEGSIRAVFLNFGYFALMLGAFLCIYFMEKYQIYIVRRFFFTYLFSILLIIFIIVFFFSISNTQNLTFIFWPLFILFFLLYFREFRRKAKIQEYSLLYSLVFFSWFACLAIGFFLTTDFSMNNLGSEYRLLGAGLQLFAILSLSLFLMKLPPFSEFDWQEKIENVYLIDLGGICIYNQSDSESIDKHLVSGAISSINIMLQELTNRKGISVIKKKGKTVIVYPSKYSTGVLFCSEDLNTPKIVLKDFVLKFETIYSHVLQNWDGDIEIFNPVEKMANKFFLNKQMRD